MPTIRKSNPIKLASIAASLLIGAPCLHAQLIAPSHPAAQPFTLADLGDRWENLGLLYKDKNSKGLNELWILGRFHGQYHHSDGDVREHEDYETRRLRMGGQARLFQKLTLHAQMVSGSDVEPFYNGFTELWAGWAFEEWLVLTLGQQKHRFTHDRNISSRYLNYLERGMLTNMFGLDYTPAVTLSGRTDHIWYYTGIFSNATDQNMYESFTELNSGCSYLSTITFDLEKALGTDTAHLNLGYVYSDANENATNMDRYDHGLSAALILTDGPASLVTEVLAGSSGNDSTGYGINIQPGLFITDEIQLVARYQIAASTDPKGLKGQRRYERPTGMPSGDLYQAGYLGVNYYIAKHRLKLMSGLEYSDMNGSNVLTASAMVRFYFGPHSGAPFPGNMMLDGMF